MRDGRRPCASAGAVLHNAGHRQVLFHSVGPKAWARERTVREVVLLRCRKVVLIYGLVNMTPSMTFSRGKAGRPRSVPPRLVFCEGSHGGAFKVEIRSGRNGSS